MKPLKLQKDAPGNVLKNYSAQGYALLTHKQKDAIKVELAKKGHTIEDYEAELKKGWPKEVHLPKARWGKRKPDWATGGSEK